MSERKVSTDALETLGTIIDVSQKRDAIHLAVAPVRAATRMYPGEHIAILDGVARRVVAGAGQGIVDPFLTEPIEPDQFFWFVMYPRKVTSLRHVWSHPDFADENGVMPAAAALDPVATSWKWIDAFAADLDQTRNRLMEAARRWVECEDYTYDNSETYKDHWEKFEEFWTHYEVVTGKTVTDKSSFFTCSC